MSLKQKTVNGLIWSFIDQFANLGISFITGIVLARILSPREFGLIGMIAVFIAVSESFINGGFSSALIRKKECTNEDFSTVFYFNLIAGILFFIILYLSAPLIAGFFEEPQLKLIVQVLGVVLIIDSLTLIQKTILSKRVDFKLQARISVIASVGSGVVAIAMAMNGFGVWSLVVQRLVRQGLNSVFLWIWSSWRPIRVFSKKSFDELFGFGSKLLFSNLLDTLYRNIYYFIIGKYFSANELGFYSRADQFQALPSSNLHSIISRVSYPVLSEMQHEKDRLRTNYQKLIRSTMFITFVLMIGMAAVAEPMILTLIGEKWRPSIVYLQMLCFVGMMFPLHALNLNMLQVAGRSDLFLKLEVVKKLLAVPTILAGIIWGIKIMIVGMMVNNIIAYFLNSYWSGRFVAYSTKQQIADLLPSLGFALLMGIFIFVLGMVLPFAPGWILGIQVVSGATFVVLLSELTRFNDYLFVKKLLIDKLKDIRK